MIPLAAGLTALSLLGYHLTFDAEMSNPSDMSQFINTFENGDTRLYNNNEAESYVPYDPTNPALPYNFVNGALVLTASPVPAGGVPYTSGMLETYGIFAQSSGYFEIRAATPAGQGFWPAFWLLPAAYYPEIDVLEQPNNSGTTTQYWTHTSTPTDSSGGFTETGVDVTHGYHRYGFLWTNNFIQYVFDGNFVGWSHNLPPSMVGLQMYMIANLAVGNPASWPGAPLAGASSSFSIDYIRAYSNDPTVPAVSQEPISSPDGVNTLPVLVPPTPAAPKTVWSGPDSLVLLVSEDACAGDAQFTVSIDGRPWGGVQTTTASHAFGQAQPFTFKANFGPFKRTATVNFINDFSNLDCDRNLFVSGATFNGVTIQNAVLNEYGGGPQSFGFTGKQLPTLAIGTGPDTFIIDVSQVPHTGNGRFTLAVDGVAQGSGVLTASADHTHGQTQAVAVNGTFGPAAHTVKLTFLNGAVSGSKTDYVDLFVDGVSYNGIAAPNSTLAMTTRGTASLTTAAIIPDMLTVNLAEDAWQGDAQAQISVDGIVLDTPVITALQSAGATQTLTYSGLWGGANVGHSVVVNYLNDAYAGPGQDRNLHVGSVVLDGTTIGSQSSLMRAGPMTFTYAPPGGVTGWH